MCTCFTHRKMSEKQVLYSISTYFVDIWLYSKEVIIHCIWTCSIHINMIVKQVLYSMCTCFTHRNMIVKQILFSICTCCTSRNMIVFQASSRFYLHMLHLRIKSNLTWYRLVWKSVFWCFWPKWASILTQF